MIFRRKASDELLKWKEECHGTYAALLEWARRVGKSTIAEAFAKAEYKSYVKIDFSDVRDDILSIFDSIGNLDLFFFKASGYMNGIL